MTPSPAKITAVLTARPGKAVELHALLTGMQPHCRAEPGNLRWDLWRDTAHADCFVIDELYRDAAALEAHRQTPHYLAYREKVPELADRTAWVLEPIDVK
jgi:quinol monooxygenase YgiN